MSEETPLALQIALTCAGRATLSQPDCVRIVFDEPLLTRISKSLAALGALDLAGARITLPLDAVATFTANGRPWPSEDRKDASFVVFSLRMHVEPERLHIEFREAYEKDVLDGFFEFRDLPALREALRQLWRWSEEEPLHGTRNAPPAVTAQLVHALQLAEPWLVKLGDHIGNGTPQDPLGRCLALFAVRQALSLGAAAVQATPAGDASTASATPLERGASR